MRNLRMKFDLPTSEYIYQMPVWNEVFSYPIPAGYKGYISFLNNFYIADEVDFCFLLTDKFWADVSGRNIIAEQWQGTNRNLLVRLRYPDLANFSLNTMDTYNGNGTWVAFGDASNVRTNNLYYHNGNGSVAFDLTYSTGAGGIYNSTMHAIDLSEPNINGIGTLFDWSLFPQFLGWTSITFQYGSSPTDYWQQTVTGPFGGVPFSIGWNQLGFSWTGATVHGSPNASSITFLRYTLNFPSSMPPQIGVSLDDVWMRQQILMNLTYSSEYLVQDPSGNLYEEFVNYTSSATWVANIPTEFKDWIVYNVLLRAFTFIKPVVLNVQDLNNRIRDIKIELDNAYPPRRTLQTDNYYETVPENPVPDTQMGTRYPWGSDWGGPTNW